MERLREVARMMYRWLVTVAFESRLTCLVVVLKAGRVYAVRDTRVVVRRGIFPATGLKRCGRRILSAQEPQTIDHSWRVHGLCEKEGKIWDLLQW